MTDATAETQEMRAVPGTIPAPPPSSPPDETEERISRVSIEDDRATGPRSPEERLDLLERSNKRALDELVKVRETANAVPGMRRDYSEFERVVLNMLARQNNAMTVLLARGHNDKTEELAGHVVLVVEDDEDVQRAIRQLLRNAGANVFYERTALEARERIDQVGPAVFTCAVLDVRLPDSEGTDFANEVRRCAPRCGIVLTSGYPLDEFEESSQRHGFALLEKPFEVHALIDAVLAAVQLRSQP